MLMLLNVCASCTSCPIELCADTVYVVELCHAMKYDRYSGSNHDFGYVCCSAGLHCLRCCFGQLMCLHCKFVRIVKLDIKAVCTVVLAAYVALLA